MNFYDRLVESLNKEKFVLRVKTTKSSKIFINSNVRILYNDPKEKKILVGLYSKEEDKKPIIVYDEEGIGRNRSKDVVEKILEIEEITGPVTVIHCEVQLTKNFNGELKVTVERNSRFSFGVKSDEFALNEPELFKHVAESINMPFTDRLKEEGISSILYTTPTESTCIFKADGSRNFIKMEFISAAVETIQ